MRLLSLTAHNFRGFGSSPVTVGLGAVWTGPGMTSAMFFLPVEAIKKER